MPKFIFDYTITFSDGREESRQEIEEFDNLTQASDFLMEQATKFAMERASISGGVAPYDEDQEAIVEAVLKETGF